VLWLRRPVPVPILPIVGQGGDAVSGLIDSYDLLFTVDDSYDLLFTVDENDHVDDPSHIANLCRPDDVEGHGLALGNGYRVVAEIRANKPAFLIARLGDRVGPWPTAARQLSPFFRMIATDCKSYAVAVASAEQETTLRVSTWLSSAPVPARSQSVSQFGSSSHLS
jgi:hypothetical protein